MTRRVLARRPADAANALTNGGAAADDFLARLMKYIPAEMVGLYLAVKGIVPPDAPALVLWIFAAAAWVLVPLYLWYATTRGGSRVVVAQVALATIAFPVWVAAVGGRPLSDLAWYVGNEYVGSIVLIFVTVVFGMIEPPRET